MNSSVPPSSQIATFSHAAISAGETARPEGGTVVVGEALVAGAFEGLLAGEEITGAAGATGIDVVVVVVTDVTAEGPEELVALDVVVGDDLVDGARLPVVWEWLELAARCVTVGDGSGEEPLRGGGSSSDATNAASIGSAASHGSTSDVFERLTHAARPPMVSSHRKRHTPPIGR